MKKARILSIGALFALAMAAGQAAASADLHMCGGDIPASAISPSAAEVAAHRHFKLPVIHYKGRIELAGGFDLTWLVDATGKPVCIDSLDAPEPPAAAKDASEDATADTSSDQAEGGGLTKGVAAMTSFGYFMTPERVRSLKPMKTWRYTPFTKDGVNTQARVKEHFEETVQADAVAMPKGRLFTTVITLWRSNCFGTCPDYSVTIRGDGQVTYRGNGFTNVPGVVTYRISPGEAAALIERLRARDLWSMRASYQSEVTDNPTYRLRVTVGGKTKTVDDYVGLAAGMPKAVVLMENDVDATSGAMDLVTLTPRGLARLDEGHFDFTGQPGGHLLINVLQNNALNDEMVNAVLDRHPPLTGIRTRLAGYDISDRSSALDAALAVGREAVVPRLIQGGALLVKGKPDQARVDSAFQSAISGGRESLVETLWAWHPGLTFKSFSERGFDEKLTSVSAPVSLLLYHDGTSNDRWQGFAIARFLIGQGCDINGKDADGRTLLMAAALDGDPAYVGWLLSHGADVKPVDNDGDSALTHTYDEDTALVLLEAGADPTIEPQYGKSFLALVSSDNWTRVIDWLEHHGYAAKLKAAAAS